MPEASVTPIDLFGDEFASPNLPDVTKTEDEQDTSTLSGSPTDDADQQEDDDISQNEQGEYVQEIDLGDGAGKQVFKSKSLTGLVKELTKAQENATRKIRQQEFDLKRRVKVEPERIVADVKKATRELSADELYQLSLDMQTNPEKALDKLLEAKIGHNLTGLQSKLDNVDRIIQGEAMKAAQVEFVNEHKDDFLPSAQNAKAIESFLLKENLSLTKKNLEYAFQELTSGGLLDMPASKETNQRDESQVVEDQRIAVKPHTRQKPSSMGVSNKNGGSRTTPFSDEKSQYEKAVEDIKNTTDIDQARMKMLKLMNSKKSA
jgi:hypothetical protein